MNKIILATIISLALVSSAALAFTITPFDVIAPGQPTQPGTGDNTCVQYQTQGAWCDQYILIYQQCMPTTTGNYWYQQQVDCRGMGTGYTCINNQCAYVPGSSTQPTGGFCSSGGIQSWMCSNPVLTILIIGLAVAIIWKRKK